MFRILLCVSLIAITAAPVVACPFVAPDGSSMTFDEGGDEPAVVITDPKGHAVDCLWMRSDEGTGLRMSCADSDEFFERSEAQGGVPAIVYQGQTWARSEDCAAVNAQ